MKLEITILGCGSSSGVPAIGNNWGNCDPSNSRNYRLRSSILIKYKDTSLLVDATPDLRQQLLSANITYLDGVLITHCHADHINGIDDFRFLNVIMNKDLNLYATKNNIDEIKNRFSYVFEKLSPRANGFYYKPCLIPNEINGHFKVNNLDILSFQQDHGFGESTGFRINNFAYSSDVFDITPDTFEKLKNLDLWIVDCLRFEPHKSHAHFEKVMKWINLIKPKRTILTHMNYEVDYDYINSLCPKNCEAAYDGLKLII